MKKNLNRFLLFAVVISLTIAGFLAFGSSQSLHASQSIDIDLMQSAKQSEANSWVSQYWSYIALLASEVLAFVPSRFNGLAHAILSIGNSLFSHLKK
jgi:hypothetical protein